MYAIIETGGKQIRVEEGQEIFVEKINVEQDEKFVFDKVLMIGGENTVVGNPYVAGATVEATCVKQGRAKKIIVYKYKAKKNYHKKQGHRQAYTKFVVNTIKA